MNNLFTINCAFAVIEGEGVPRSGCAVSRLPSEITLGKKTSPTLSVPNRKPKPIMTKEMKDHE